ncbi:hypothetical protein ABIF39_005349 [Bradyrhizobium diazoefficiens]
MRGYTTRAGRCANCGNSSAEPHHAVVRNEGELVGLAQAGADSRQELPRGDVAELEIGERQQVVDDADHLGVRPALDRHAGRGVHDDHVVVARIYPRRRQQEEGRGILIVEESGLELKVAEQFEVAQIRRNVFERGGPVLDQSRVQAAQADRAQEAEHVVPRQQHAAPLAEPVEFAARAAERHRPAHVDLVKEAIKRQQLDVARLRREQLCASLAPAQFAVALRGLDQQREFVALRGERTHQLPGEMEDAALVVWLSERLGDDQDVLFHARFSRSSKECVAGGSTVTVEAMRP